MATLTNTQRQLFETLHNSRMEDFKTFNKKSYRGVWSSIIDKYPESAHFVYELLQNADDAEATEVTIILKKDRLLFKHNGSKHFDITKEDADKVGDINSITGIGDSSKTDTQNKIGKFGVGFKAVFQYTDTPEIYDDYFKFKIENYIVPTLLNNDHPERIEGETLFVFPFKNSSKSYQEIYNRLDKLQNPILFLRHLNKIVWKIDDEIHSGKEIEYSKDDIESKSYSDNISLQRFKLNEPNKSSEIFLFSQDVDITDEDGVESSHIINVGFYYDSEKKRLITENTHNIFCFFPTKETFKTCFVSHAPFLLTDNRQNLKPSENLNKDLVRLLAELAAKAVICLRDYKIDDKVKLINENITEIIPTYVKNYWEELDEVFEEPIVDAFSEMLSNERVLLSRNGKYLSIHEAHIGSPRELVDLLSPDQLSFLREDCFDDDDFDETLDLRNIDFLKWELSQNIKKQENSIYEDIEEFTSEDFARNISETFMKDQDQKWVVRMYHFFSNSASTLWKLTDKTKVKNSLQYPVRRAPIIKTQNGDWVAPFVDGVTPNVYFPLKDDNKTSEYNFISSDYLTIDAAKRFFVELGIKEPNENDYIRQVILKKFEGNDVEVDNDELSSDFEILVGYYQKILNPSYRQEYISLLKDKIYIVGKDDTLHRPNTLYFYNSNLETYYENSDSISFIDLDFYKSTISKFGIELVRSFVSDLGVLVYPKVNEVRRSGYYGIWGLSERIKKLFSTEDFSEYYLDDFELHGFKDFCKQDVLDKDVSVYLWNEVLPAINFSKFENLTLVYRRKYARTYNRAPYTSTFKDLLIHSEWIVDVNDEVMSPSQIALEDLAPEYDRNNGLIQFLCIEKREKSIIELGGTEEQQEQLDLGKRIRNIAGNELTEDEIIQALAEAKARKQGKMITPSWNQPSPVEEPIENPIPPEKPKHHPGKGKSEQIPQGSDGNDDSEDEPENTPSPFSRPELKKHDISNMFVTGNIMPSSQPKEDNTGSEEDDVDDIMRKLIEQEEKHNKIKELREIAATTKKYTKEWFNALIELEYRGGAADDNTDFSKAISITFSSVHKDEGSERIYVFNNPSHSIPLWMEEICDIEVKCHFSNREEMTLKFEVANVRENSLRLKASKIYEEVLKRIEWNKCTKATITLKNQIDLMGKVRTAFNALEFEDGFNLKDNLRDNLRFIFGPPGTGKTTTLANKIISKMSENQGCKILVLAPTNTACDELARKIIDISDDNCSWLSRFISASDEDLEDIVVDRESLVYDDEKCCIISTMARLSFDGFNGQGGYHRLTDIDWDYIICDEASMIPLAEMAITIYNFTNIPIIIAGDPMQIKPILHEEEWKDENIYTMVKLDRFDNPITEPIQFEIENLTTQYRSLPAIGRIFSEYAYDGKLNHYRTEISKNEEFGKLRLKPINFIPFKVEKYDSVFGIKKLDGSNVHIYSVLFTFEMFKYIIKHLPNDVIDDFSIGVVCPYSPQAQLIESLIHQTPDIPSNIKITVGTVHRFQGGQCNLMFVVLNPPLGMKTASRRIFLNNKNILNVAISRAQDYLCILLPHRDTDGYENLYEINKIGNIALDDVENVTSYTSDQIEEILFGRKFYIESNTFVTSHQLTNVYTKATNRYEVRIDDKSVDIQLGNEKGKVYVSTENMVISSCVVDTSGEENVDNDESQISTETNNQNLLPESNEDIQKDILTEIEESRGYSAPEEYYSLFSRIDIDFAEAIELLASANTACSLYVLVQIFGNPEISGKYGWKNIGESDIKNNKKILMKYAFSKSIYAELFQAVRWQRIAIKGIGDKQISTISFNDFMNAYNIHMERKKQRALMPRKPKKAKRQVIPKATNYNTYSSYGSEKSGNLYTDFEYGLSDW